MWHQQAERPLALFIAIGRGLEFSLQVWMFGQVQPQGLGVILV